MIVKNEKGEIYLYCKGADSILEKLMDPKWKTSNNQIFDKTYDELS